MIFFISFQDSLFKFGPLGRSYGHKNSILWFLFIRSSGFGLMYPTHYSALWSFSALLFSIYSALPSYFRSFSFLFIWSSRFSLMYQFPLYQSIFCMPRHKEQWHNRAIFPLRTPKHHHPNHLTKFFIIHFYQLNIFFHVN